MQSVQEHFTSVAPVYRQLRTTDEAPIDEIRRSLGHKIGLRVADIGCGTGRYSQLLFDYLGPDTTMFCVDFTRAMLDEMVSLVDPDILPRFAPMRASASELPFADGSLDVITTFNAIHHFDVDGFLSEVRRVLKPDGKAFLYTRLRDQNETHIWGRYFPNFCEKEDRLYTESELRHYISNYFESSNLSFTPFSFRRRASIEELLEQAEGRHYSTFSLYDLDEFNYSLREFERGIREAYPDPSSIRWTDFYTLVSLSDLTG